MRLFTFIGLIVLLISSPVLAQKYSNGSLIKNDNTTLSGKLLIDNKQKKVILVKDSKTSSFAFKDVSAVMINGRSFSKTAMGDSQWFAMTLVTGKASLFKISEEKFAIKKEDGTHQIIDKNKANAKGFLAVLFKDCNEVRKEVLSEQRLNQSTLTAHVTNYNNCAYSNFAPTEEELIAANRFNTDQLKVFIGAGIGFNNTSFFDSKEKEGTSSVGLNFGIIASPAFIGSLQGNLYFGMEVSANLSSSVPFKNAPNAIDYKANIYRWAIDSRYHLNKKGSFQPFVGIGVGFSGSTYKGTYQRSSLDINVGDVFYTPKAGVLVNLSNKKSLGLTVSYIPAYSNDLSFDNGENTVPLIINNEFINTGLFFYF